MDVYTSLDAVGRTLTLHLQRTRLNNSIKTQHLLEINFLKKSKASIYNGQKFTKKNNEKFTLDNQNQKCFFQRYNSKKIKIANQRRERTSPVLRFNKTQSMFSRDRL